MVGLPSFCSQYVLPHRLVQHQIGEEQLELATLLRELLQPPKIGDPGWRTAFATFAGKAQKWASFLVRVDPFSGDRSCHRLPWEQLSRAEGPEQTSNPG